MLFLGASKGSFGFAPAAGGRGAAPGVMLDDVLCSPSPPRHPRSSGRTPGFTSSDETVEPKDAEKGEPLPERPFELGLGYQHVGSLDYFAPAVAFRYVLALGLDPHRYFSVSAEAAIRF